MIVLASPNSELRNSYALSLGDSYTLVELPDLSGLTKLLATEQPDIVFVDIAILTARPQAALRTLCLDNPDTSFVVFGCPDDRALCLPLLTAGARGLLRVTSPPQLAPKVIQAVKRGELWVTRRGLAMLLHELQPPAAKLSPGYFILSERELQVGRTVAAGLSNKEIARSLDISERTVKAHISSLFRKLGINNRAELIRLNQNTEA